MAFDKTITCTIVDDSDKNNGRYRVTDGSSKFIAYSETKTFRNKDIVYVTVPKGDFGEQKVIIGKKTEVEEEPFNYVRPFDNFLPCTNNVLINIPKTGLIANENNKEETSLNLQTQNISMYKNFTRLGIKANFQSLLTKEQIKSGEYGLKITISAVTKDKDESSEFVYTLVPKEALLKINENLLYIYNDIDKVYVQAPSGYRNIYSDLNFFVQGKEVKQNEDGEWIISDLIETKKREIFTLFLNTKDIIGNPYNFEIPSEQEKVFDISHFDYIDEIVVSFYQKNNFYKKNGEKLLPNQFSNLFVENIQIMFGFDLSEIDNEFLQLFTFDPMNYQHSENNKENIKHIELRWAHKDGDKLSVFNKDNMEDWYDTIYDNQEEENKPYEIVIDNSSQRVDKRQYYELNAEKEGSFAKAGYNMVYNYGGAKEAGDYRYNLISFVPTSKYNKNEIYFRKSLLTLEQIKENGYFEILLKGLSDDTQVKEILQPYLYGDKQIERKRVPLPLSKRKDFAKYNIYLKTETTFSPVSILSENDFELGKIYYYDENIPSDEGNFYYIYEPIHKDNPPTDMELNTWKIYKPVFEKTNKDNKMYYYIDENYLKKVENFEYKSGQYYYKRFNLDNITINWYRYKSGAPAADKYSGIYWEKIDVCKEGKETTCIEATDSLPFECTLVPDSIHNKTEQIKAILILNGVDGEQVYYSNILTFENKNDVISTPTTQQEYALRLQIDDNTQGNYLIYDENNGIIDNEQSTRIRSITALFDKADFNSKTLLKDATKVTWVFPIKNTMLKVNYNAMDGQYSEDGFYATVITKTASEEYKLYYSIENNFAFNKNNNTITCTIEKDGEIFSTTQEFTFGQSGSNGSDYTLVLDLLTSDNMITLNPTNNLIGFRHIDQEQESYNSEEYYYVYNNLLKQYEGKKLSEEEYQKQKDNLFIKVTSEIALYKALSKLDDKVYEQRLNNWLEYYDAIETINKDGALTEEERIRQIAEISKRYYDQEYQGYYINQCKQTLEDLKKVREKFNNKIKDLPQEQIKEQRIETLKEILKDLQVQQNLLENYSYSKKDKNEKEHYIKVNTTTPIEDNKIRATLYDQTGHQINNGEYTITWSWFIAPKDNQLFGEIISDNILLNGQNEAYIPLIKEKLVNNNMSQLWIVQATVTGFGDYDLTAYLPIPLRWDYGVTRYQGPTQIIYSATGLPNYYKDEINLYYNDTSGKEQQWIPKTGFEIITTTEDKTEKQYQPILVYDSKCYTKEKKYITTKEIQNEKEKISYDDIINEDNSYFIKKETESEPKRAYWAVGKKIYYDEEGTGIQKEINLASTDNIDKLTLSISKENFPENFYYIVETKSENTTNAISVSMQPKAIYVDCAPFGISYTYKENGNNNIIEFTQPILNIQNRYFSSTINKWDGSLQVDNEQNTILAKMIGAGRKNQDNTFSGVVMGDWTGNVNTNDEGTISLRDKPGLYGFHKGETSFGFTSEGIGFIGKAGRGRILLDGNNSVITSANWIMNGNMKNSLSNTSSKGNQGLYMKIDDGFILMKEGSSSSRYIKLDVLASGVISKDEGRNNTPGDRPYPGGSEDFPFVIYGDKDNFTQIGWNGNLFMRGKKPSEKSSLEGSPSGYIYLNASASKYPLDINSHFAVAWNGALTISKNSISYSEQASEIIDKDDQRKNLYNLSSNEDKLINDVTNRIIYDESDKSVDAIKSYNNNQYDYSTIKDGFKGLYATPDGDMYLSRKLIIGSNFSATADGYLKAKSALFDDCNANVFQVRYLPPGGGDEKIDFKNSSIPPYKEQTSNKLKADYTIYGANIGSMGWLEGSRDNPNFNSKEEETEDNPKTLATYNLGFKSKAGCGIVLDSATNIRIDNNKEIGGTYFNGNILQMDMNQDINILQQSEKNGRIRIGSVGQILSRSREKIRFAIEPNYTGRNYGHNFEDTTEIKDNENGTSTTNYLYNTAFALDDKNIYLNYQDIVQTIIGIGNANQKDYYKFSVKTNPTTGDPYYRALTINKNGETIGTKMSSYSFDTDPNSTSAKFLLTIQGKNKEGVEQPKSFFKLYSSQTKSELSAGHGLLLQSTTGTKNPQIILGETVIGTEDEYRKGDSVIVKGGHLLVDDIPPENQKGIYARFA